ncbi:carboxylase [Streptomyces sp. Ru62]|uniref:ATP-grasp domain-containing protein n=1 Tax=Streptomyces sp. Ru62 TaxID=2080745 RepID=UPI000CDD9222|nr:ATP-grasp domain-containing protein [Streptomyces sp. Ru62]POX58825.1 carboxylase [Streptomyces sp. Ru62]
MLHNASASTTVQDRPLLLLGAGASTYREHLLQRFAAQRPVVLADSEQPDWVRPYVHDQLIVDLADTEGASAAVKRYAEQTPLSGIGTYMEHHVVLAARLARQLGLPGADPEAVAACRDKAESRRRFAAHGVPSADSQLAEDQEAAVEIARRIGYPVVVKPRGMAGSAGVVKATTDDQVRSAFQRAGWETVLGLDSYAVPGVLVEEYLSGPEISAETVVCGGEVTVVAITRKQLGPEPRFLEVGHCVDASDPLLADAKVTAAVTDAVRALGLEVGVLHIEMRLTRRGPALIEVNARPGGDLIPVLVAHATGIDLAGAATSLATGSVPDLTPIRQRAAAVRFAYPDRSGVVTRLYAPASLRFEAWLERLVFTRQPGDQAVTPPQSISERLAHWVVTGADRSECERRLAAVRSQIALEVGAPTRTTNCSR